MMPKYYDFKVAGYYLYFTSFCVVECMHVHASDSKLSEGGSAKFFVKSNGDTIVKTSTPSSYVSAGKSWKTGDVVEVLYPMYIHTEDLPGVSDYVALLYGPIVLSAKTGTANLNGLVADDGRWSHIASGALESLDQAPMLASAKKDIPSKIEPVKGEPLHFKAPYLFAQQKDANLLLQPFYEVHDARYMMYWMVLTDPSILDRLEKEQGGPRRTATRSGPQDEDRKLHLGHTPG